MDVIYINIIRVSKYAIIQPHNWQSFILTRICASVGLRMKFKNLFMSDHDLLLFLNMSNQFLAPGGSNAECVQVSVI